MWNLESDSVTKKKNGGNRNETTATISRVHIMGPWKKLRKQKSIKNNQDYVNWWHDHVHRMNLNRISKLLYNYKPGGRRDVGRPKTRWRD